MWAIELASFCLVRRESEVLIINLHCLLEKVSVPSFTRETEVKLYRMILSFWDHSTCSVHPLHVSLMPVLDCNTPAFSKTMLTRRNVSGQPPKSTLKVFPSHFYPYHIQSLNLSRPFGHESGRVEGTSYNYKDGEHRFIIIHSPCLPLHNLCHRHPLSCRGVSNLLV